MRLIKQLDTNDCAIATAACLAGVRYPEALDAAGFDGYSKGLGITAMAKLLEVLTGTEWAVRRPSRYTSLEAYEPKLEGVGNVAIVIRRPSDSWGHWVAYNGEEGRVYDPNHKHPRAVFAYPRRHWRVIRVLTMAREREGDSSTPGDSTPSSRRRGTPDTLPLFE